MQLSPEFDSRLTHISSEDLVTPHPASEGSTMSDYEEVYS